MEFNSFANDTNDSANDTTDSNTSKHNPQLPKNQRYLGTVKRHLKSQDRKRPSILDITPSLISRVCPGVTTDQAEQVSLLAARDCFKLEESDAASDLFASAADLINDAPEMLSVGCRLIDHALRGGLRRGAVTEVCGESSAGKTQFCLQAAVQAQLVAVDLESGEVVKSYGGQQGSAEVGGGGKVVYICTEDQFPSERLSQMLTARYGSEQCIEVKTIRDGILIQRPREVAELETVIGPRLESLLAQGGVSLVILDSIAALLRGEFEGEGLARANTIHRLGMRLNNIASDHGVAVLVVNQVSDYIDQPQCSFGRGVVPALGMSWSNYVHTRLFLTKTRLVVSATPNAAIAGIKAETRLRTLEVDISSRLPQSKTYFTVEADGIKGVRIT